MFLNQASFYGHLLCVRILVENGAKINGFNKIKLTPLFAAVEKGHLKVVSYFIERGIKPESMRADGKSLSEIAKQCGYTEIVNYLNGAIQFSSQSFLTI
jgi:ankyrin repeat protein